MAIARGELSLYVESLENGTVVRTVDTVSGVCLLLMSPRPHGCLLYCAGTREKKDGVQFIPHSQS